MGETPEISNGKTHIYTGDGKGKTTAALGLALRAAGYGLRSAVIRFLKSDKSGELLCENPAIDFFTFGCDEMYRAGKSDCIRYRKFCSDALDFIRKSAFAGGYRIVVCDEILYACRFSLITEEEILGLIALRPRDVELILTGNYLSGALAEKADLITELVCVKHYYTSGVPARRGVEF